MKIQNPLQVFREALNTHLEHLIHPKKYIPSNNSAECSGQTLHQRLVKLLRAQPPVLHPTGNNKQEISIVLWSHWSGKTQKEVKECYSQLERVNGSVLLTMEKLLGEEHQLHACQIPGVLIMNTPYVLSDFPHRLSGLLDKALSKDLGLRSQIYC